MIFNLFNQSCIQIVLGKVTQQELFNTVCGQLEKEGYVTSDYKNQLAERELNYPTGIQIKEFGIAIPHTDNSSVKKPVIFVSLIPSGVTWGDMEDINNSINVQIVFNLVLDKKENHMEILQEIVLALQDNQFISELGNSNNSKELFSILERRFKK